MLEDMLQELAELQDEYDDMRNVERWHVDDNKDLPLSMEDFERFYPDDFDKCQELQECIDGLQEEIEEARARLIISQADIDRLEAREDVGEEVPPTRDEWHL